MRPYSYNILRWIGLIGLLGEQCPVRHTAKRRRIKTVIQELMYLAVRLIRTDRRLKLRFSQACPGFIAFEATYAKLAVGWRLIDPASTALHSSLRNTAVRESFI